MIAEAFRLSPQQRRRWLAGATAPARLLVKLTGPVDEALLREAVERVVAGHESLRTVLVHQPGLKTPLQGILDEARIAWKGWEGDGSEAVPVGREAVERALEEAAARLATGEEAPLLAAVLGAPEGGVDDQDQAQSRHLGVAIAGHGADEPSLRVLFDALAAAYRAAAGPGAEVPEEPIQYLQFSEWQYELQEGEGLDEGQRFWQEHLAGVSPALLPWDRGLPEGEGEGTIPAEAAVTRPLPELPRLAERYGVSARPVAVAFCQELLRRLTGASRGQLACRVEGRRFPELQDTIGLLSRWLPLGNPVGEGTGVVQAVAAAEAAMADADAWQEFLPEDHPRPSCGLAIHSRPWPHPVGAAGGEPVTFELAAWRAPSTAFPLELRLELDLDGALLTAFHDPRRLTREAVEAWLDQLRQLLASALEAPAAAGETPLEDLEVLPLGQRKALLEGFNDTGEELPTAPLHERLTRRAEETPEAPAVAALGSEEAVLTYGELDALSTALAHHLRTLGVGPETRVGLFLERSPGLLVALLAVNKAGGAWVPLDPASPSGRLETLLEEVGAPLILTSEPLGERLPDGGWSEEGRVLSLGPDPREWPQAAVSLPTAEPLPAVDPESLAYVLFTSGSTGRPKGVLVPHRGLANYLAWAVDAYGLEAGSTSLVHSPLAFDLTLTTFLAPLLVGGQVLLVPEGQGFEELGRALLEGGFDLVKLTPSHLRMLNVLLEGAAVDDGADEAGERAGVRTLVLGGEALSPSLVAPWGRRWPRTRVVNEYGPTETVVGCVVAERRAGDLVQELADEPAPRAVRTVPIGQPIANLRAYLLDRRLRPVAAGMVGELWIGGRGVTRGYLGNPAETAWRFVPDPFGDQPGERLYRTGDRCRFQPVEGSDGRLELEFLGRSDDQVKIRGFRIEPAEVVVALARHPAIRETVVVVQDAGQNTGPGADGAEGPDGPEARLVAYVTVAEGREAPAYGALREFLGEHLPDPMIPAAVVPVDALPITPNGKIDREALVAMGAEPAARPQGSTAAFVAPETEAERQLAEIWQEVLHLERVGIYDSFFELGGHSLLMVQVFGRLKAVFDTELTMAELFEFPTIRDMARRLTDGGDGEEEAEEERDRMADVARTRRRAVAGAAAAQARRRQATAALEESYEGAPDE